ncbi:MAG: putative 10 drug/metabolite exporter, family, superfamily [Holophagaceae bacterium]|nr:putative 10 drug/metabolite exporter, family, superfamily [Holophagaceae bacterium]
MAAPEWKTPADRAVSPRWGLALAFFAVFVVWGTTYLAIRYAVETIPPLVAAAIRHLTAGTILLGFAWSRGFRPRRAHWIAGSVVGALFFLIGHGSLHWAEQYVPSGLAALLIASEPLWILVMGSALGQQRVNGLNGTGLLLGLAGVAALTAPTLTSMTVGTWAMVAVIAGAASWALGVCLSPRLSLPDDAMGRAAVPMLCGGIMLLASAGLTGEIGAVRWSAISLKSMLGLGYLITFGSILAFTAYTWLLQRVSPTLVATHTFVNPVVAVLAGWLWASEPLSARLLVSTLLILLAVLLVQRGERSAKRLVDEAQPG